jgi:hypothetical protein
LKVDDLIDIGVVEWRAEGLLHLLDAGEPIGARRRWLCGSSAHPSVGHQHRTGRKAALVGGEIKDGLRDFIGTAVPSERNQLIEETGAIFADEVLQILLDRELKSVVDRSQMDRIHANAAGSKFLGEAAHQADRGVLRRDVGIDTRVTAREQRGNPILFASSYVHEVAMGERHIGCKKLANEYPDDVFRYAVTHDRYTADMDMDTPQDYARMLERLGLAEHAVALKALPAKRRRQPPSSPQVQASAIPPVHGGRSRE